MLSRGAQKCLDLLRWYAARFGEVYPYQDTIAKRLGVTDRQVRRLLGELKAAHLIQINKQGRNPATYQLLPVENVRSMSGRCSVECPVECPVESSASITECFSDLVLPFGITVTYFGQAASANCLAAILARRV